MVGTDLLGTKACPPNHSRKPSERKFDKADRAQCSAAHEPDLDLVFLQRFGKIYGKGIRDIGLHVRIGDIKLAGFDVSLAIHGIAEGENHRNQPGLLLVLDREDRFTGQD